MGKIKKLFINHETVVSVDGLLWINFENSIIIQNILLHNKINVYLWTPSMVVTDLTSIGYVKPPVKFTQCRHYLFSLAPSWMWTLTNAIRSKRSFFPIIRDLSTFEKKSSDNNNHDLHHDVKKSQNIVTFWSVRPFKSRVFEETVLKYFDLSSVTSF